MANVGTIKKQPQEVLAFTVSYSDAIGGATPDSITPVITSLPSGLTISGTAVTGSVLRSSVASGVTGQTYIITVRSTIVVTGVTQVLEDEIKVVVKEIS